MIENYEVEIENVEDLLKRT